MVVLQFLSSGQVIYVYGVEISDACLTAIWLTARKSDLFLAGKRAGLGMNIIQYLDKDQLNRPQESYGEVYIYDVPACSPISTDQLIKSFPCVFADGVGALAGEYHIVLDESARPVQHPPRRVPVAIRECLRETLEDLEKHMRRAR